MSKVNIEEVLRHVEEETITPEMEEYVNKEVFWGKEYVFMDKEKETGYCTYCNTEIKDKKIINHKHKEWGKCPNCKAPVTFRSSKIGRKNASNPVCIYFFERYKEFILCKGLFIRKDYEKFREKDIKYCLSALYVFTKEEQIMLRKIWGNKLERTKTCYPFDINGLAIYETYISEKSILNAIKDTEFKYMPVRYFVGPNFNNKYGKYRGDARTIINLFETYSKYPWIEQLCKIGFSSIVGHMICKGKLMNCINKRGKTVFEVLKMNRAEVKEIVNSGIEITPEYMNLFKLKKRQNSKTKIEKIIEVMDKIYDSDKEKAIKKFEEYKIDKVIRYLEKQTKMQDRSISRVYTTWEDYLNDCKELNYNLQDMYNVMPRDLVKAHEKTIEKVKYKRSEVMDEKIKASLEKREKMFTYRYKGLMIRPAKSSKEVINEGAILHHCVGGYVKPYAEENTNILLIRRIKNQKKPFYTVEVKKNEVRQVYGYKDCVATEEVKEFMEQFKKNKLKKNGVKADGRK